MEHWIAHPLGHCNPDQGVDQRVTTMIYTCINTVWVWVAVGLSCSPSWHFCGYGVQQLQSLATHHLLFDFFRSLFFKTSFLSPAVRTKCPICVQTLYILHAYLRSFSFSLKLIPPLLCLVKNNRRQITSFMNPQSFCFIH